jgi:CheY-like chemotaxis protein
MRHSATHILDLTRNLLDFHSLETTLQKNEPFPFSPHDLLTDIYESFIPEARKKELNFDLDMDINIDQKEIYVSDPYRIRLILNNILSNALKFTPPKGSVLLSAFLIRTKRKTELLLSVKDTGPGIKKEDINRIFEEFRRLDHASEGLGLGLNIALKLAQSLGGSISVDSMPDKGSIFTVVLPLLKSDPVVKSDPAIKNDPESAKTAPLPPHTDKTDESQTQTIAVCVGEPQANLSDEPQAPDNQPDNQDKEMEQADENKKFAFPEESHANNLPLDERTTENEEDMTVEENIQEPHPANAGPKILFIDNDSIQLDLLSNLLKRKGLIPYTCSSSIKALDMLQQEHFDMIFSDIRMPDMNGFELVFRIRSLDSEEMKTIPIIGLSAQSQISEEKYKDAGFSEFLIKPFTSGQLLNIIRKYTSGEENFLPIEENSTAQEENGFQALIKFAGDDRKAVLSIIHSFIEETEKNHLQLDRAFESDDWETVQDVSHKMLPLMKMISAQKLVLLLQDYEKGGKSKENKVLLLELIRKKIKEAESISFSTI